MSVQVFKNETRKAACRATKTVHIIGMKNLDSGGNTMAEQMYDVAIIGAGPGGYVAAIRARQLGLKTVVIEKDKPGGVCLNVGRIPSKALIHQAQAYAGAAALGELGAAVDLSGFKYDIVFRKSRAVADRLSKGVVYLLKKNRVDYVQGAAIIRSPNEIQVDGKSTIKTKNIIVATGSRPREIPGFAFDGKVVLSSTDALMLEKLPRRMLILGAGAIGMEFAFMLSSFGVEVTIVEMMGRILPLEDAETVEVVRKEFVKRGVTIHVGTKASGVKKTKDGALVSLTAKDSSQLDVTVDQVLVGVGRAPNTEGLGLEAVGVVLERGYVTVGDYGQTSVPGVYAIGDVVPTPMLAHVASKEGEIAVERIAGLDPARRVPQDEIPSVVYCEPQVGSFGLTEEEAVSRGVRYKKAVFPFVGVGKAVATEVPEGMVKILFDPMTDDILGAHIVGDQATEIVHEILLARRGGLSLDVIAEMIHAHPTLSEGVMEAARMAEGWAIHI